MTESVPAEAKRQSASETKSVTRTFLEVHATSVREVLRLEWLVGGQECGGFASGQVSQLAIFWEPLSLERREAHGKFFFSFRPSRCWMGIDWPELPGSQGMEQTQVSRDDRSRRQSGALRPWRCAESVVGLQLCSPWSCSRHISTGENAVTQTFKFLCPNGGWRPKLGDTPIPSSWENWRGRRMTSDRVRTVPHQCD